MDKGSANITDGSTTYLITGVQENSSYSISVTAINPIASTASAPITAMTGEAGEGHVTW